MKRAMTTRLNPLTYFLAPSPSAGFLCALLLFVCGATAQAQRGGNNDWVTDNANPQRTSTVKADAKINKDSVAKPGAVKFLWKLKLKDENI